MKKQDEISILQSLKGDTYFALLFGDATIDAMCQNIQNDYPIECGIKIFQESDVAKENARLKGKLAERWHVEELAARDILRKAGIDDNLKDIAERLVGVKKCLRLKLEGCIDLDEYDRAELIGLLNEK